MYIFYDFETSDKDFLAQILSYSFIVVDDRYQIINELNGTIKPNRLECPSVGAILTNKLSISTLLNSGKTEYEAAQSIYKFLESTTQTYGPIPLVGFNSARFDFKHYEKLLLKYGFSPTFYGKIGSLDVLQFARYCALQKPSVFPFTKSNNNGTPYYSFKLEDLAKSFNCLATPQTHDAKDDVLLTIELVKAMETELNITLERFFNTQKSTTLLNSSNKLLIESYFSYEQPSDTPTINTNEWFVIGKASKTTYLLLNKTKFLDTPPTSFDDYGPLTKYLNTRSNAFICTDQTADQSFIDQVNGDPHIKKIQENAIRYFTLFPVDWDIEYRPWGMGFENIDRLRDSIESLNTDFNQYSTIIKDLLAYRTSKPKKTDEINMMIQCFNRFYLNYHPNPNPKHIYKYIEPRYITHTMYRTINDAINPINELAFINSHLNNPSTDHNDHQLLTDLATYTTSFIETYIK